MNILKGFGSNLLGVASIPEITEDFATLIPTKNHEALASAISEIFSKPDMYNIKAKKVVIQYVLDNVPDVNILYTKHGNPKPDCFDKADSWVIAQAGWLQCQERAKSQY